MHAEVSISPQAFACAGGGGGELESAKTNIRGKRRRRGEEAGRPSVARRLPRHRLPSPASFSACSAAFEAAARLGPPTGGGCSACEHVAATAAVGC